MRTRSSRQCCSHWATRRWVSGGIRSATVRGQSGGRPRSGVRCRGGSGIHGVKRGGMTGAKATASSVGSSKEGRFSQMLAGTSSWRRGEICARQPSRRGSSDASSKRRISSSSPSRSPCRAASAVGPWSRANCGRASRGAAGLAPNWKSRPLAPRSWSSASCAVGPTKAAAASNARAAASSSGVFTSAWSEHQPTRAPEARAARRALGARITGRLPVASPTGAAKRRAPFRYSPTMNA